jgi:hypothetical protein
MKNSIFWDITQFSTLKVNQRFGGNSCCSCYLHQARLFLGLFFDLEEVCDMFLWNISWPSKDCMALYPRRFSPSCPELWEPQTCIAIFWKNKLLFFCVFHWFSSVQLYYYNVLKIVKYRAIKGYESDTFILLFTVFPSVVEPNFIVQWLPFLVLDREFPLRLLGQTPISGLRFAWSVQEERHMTTFLNILLNS